VPVNWVLPAKRLRGGIFGSTLGVDRQHGFF
jgi:hypothetical protein